MYGWKSIWYQTWVYHSGLAFGLDLGGAEGTLAHATSWLTSKSQQPGYLALSEQRLMSGSTYFLASVFCIPVQPPCLQHWLPVLSSRSTFVKPTRSSSIQFPSSHVKSHRPAFFRVLKAMPIHFTMARGGSGGKLGWIYFTCCLFFLFTYS